jgi:hypothetical protein
MTLAMILREIPLRLGPGMTESRVSTETVAILIMLAGLHLNWAAVIKRISTVICHGH